MLFLVLSFLLCEPTFLYEDYEVLKDIGSKFTITIEGDAKKIGLTEEGLRTIAELRLRKEEITIVDEASREIPIVYVNINMVGPVYNVDLMIYDWAELKRRPSPNWTLVAIWTQGETGIHGEDAEWIVSSLNELFDSFFNDYYKANPKEKKRAETFSLAFLRGGMW
ncbi:unnamed protein product [marine sediment metagenome]|uniref:Uncharacterized protein n=1 Tax=marine sediment metagenome TaxID=412755 RepID=X1PN00_9ZZZZ